MQSWALVTMANETAVKRIMAAAVMAGDTLLECNRFSEETAQQSTGEMSAVQLHSAEDIRRTKASFASGPSAEAFDRFHELDVGKTGRLDRIGITELCR